MGGTKEEKKTPLINWDTMCLAKTDSGARFRKWTFKILPWGKVILEIVQKAI